MDFFANYPMFGKRMKLFAKKIKNTTFGGCHPPFVCRTVEIQLENRPPYICLSNGWNCLPNKLKTQLLVGATSVCLPNSWNSA